MTAKMKSPRNACGSSLKRGPGHSHNLAGMRMSTYEVRTDPIRINAPIDVVWKVLTDVENYGQWNPFTPQAHTDFRIGSPAQVAGQDGADDHENHRNRLCL